MNIHVLLPTESIVIEVAASDSVVDVKMKISEQAALTIDYFDMFYEGQQITPPGNFLCKTGCSNDDHIDCELSAMGRGMKKLAGMDITHSRYIAEVAAGGPLLESYLDIGMPVNSTKEYPDMMPLVVAQHASTLKLLLSRGADPCARTSDDRSPITTESTMRNTESVKLLHQSGCNLFGRYEEGYTPLMCAAKYDCISTARYIIEVLKNDTSQDLKAHLNVTCDLGLTALYLACSVDATPVAMLLLDNGSLTHNITASGSGLLHCSTQNGNFELTKTLVEHGAPINILTNDGFCPLTNSCGASIDMVNYLLDNGAVIQKPKAFVGVAYICVHDDEHQQTISLINRLLDLGASPDTPWEGCSPLSCAASIGNVDYADVLLSRGASMGCVETETHPPVEVACYNGHEAFALHLMKLCRDRSSPGECICEVSRILPNGYTTLMNSIYSGQSVELIETILDHPGVDVNASSVACHTALTNAITTDNLDVVKLLLSKNVTIDNPIPALMYSGGGVMTSILLEHGADPNPLVHKYRGNPNLVAAYQDHPDCQTLIEVVRKWDNRELLHLLEAAVAKNK
eukprot:TRINITY_DN9948_c0_g1_i1.p1 TRINITY_DN9948_c0_g1~~TRINITY_DN9948_c0_g1_i1.p1  ORF type:complete len:572 (+),score=91.07 TRINITY_DN9948_c0_g1_i1:45-1760(+)